MENTFRGTEKPLGETDNVFCVVDSCLGVTDEWFCAAEKPFLAAADNLAAMDLPGPP
jgi:hypothetical protein